MAGRRADEEVGITEGRLGVNRLSASALFGLILALAAASCLPIPHCERTAPAVLGRVYLLGAPASGVRVKRILSFTGGDESGLDRVRNTPTNDGRIEIAGVSRQEAEQRFCDLDGEWTSTDADGAFAFDAKDRFEPVVPLYGDPIWRLALCIDDGKAPRIALRVGQIGRTPETLRLECELEGQRPPSSRDLCWPLRVVR